MTLRIDTKLPAGNVAGVRIRQNETQCKVCFTANPNGNAEALWFYFRMTESDPHAHHPESLTLTLEFVNSMTGCESPSDLHPVFRGEGQGWNRARSGIVSTDDGQVSVSWTIPYPTNVTEFALCYPYGRAEIKTLLQKSKGYWHTKQIGLSQNAHSIPRISNTVQDNRSLPGVYLIAQQHAGESPGSWVLDGILQHFSRTNEGRLLVQAVPLADIGGVEQGHYGRGGQAPELDQAWGKPPLRYEIRSMQADLADWQKQCKPAIVLDFQSPGGTDIDGVYCFIPQNNEPSTAERDAEKWANVLRIAIGNEYVAETFKRERPDRSQTYGMPLDEYMRQTLAVTALTVVIPYAACGKTIMAPKQYREVGRRIARAIIQRAING